jgi:CrcB protein
MHANGTAAMADNVDDELSTKRESYYNTQRFSQRSVSDTSAGPRPQSRTHSALRRLDDLDHTQSGLEHADREAHVSSTSRSSPAPNVPYTRSDSHSKRTGKHISRSTADSRTEEDLLAPESWLHLYDQNAHTTNLPIRHHRREGRAAERMGLERHRNHRPLAVGLQPQ